MSGDVKLRKDPSTFLLKCLQEDRARRLQTAHSRGDHLIPVNEEITKNTTKLLPKDMDKYYNHPAIDELRLMTVNYKKLQEEYR